MDLVKIITGKTIEELTRIETFEEAAERELKVILEAEGNHNEVYPIGYRKNGKALLVSEAELLHMAIIGAPGQGKSKLLEYLVRILIDRLLDDQRAGIDPRDGRAVGGLFIDPTRRGGTIRKILPYCDEVGFDKVLLIDPH